MTETARPGVRGHAALIEAAPSHAATSGVSILYAMPPLSGVVAAGRHVWLGRRDYVATWEMQRALASARRDGLAPDLLLAVEHPPTITLGRAARHEHLLASEQDCAALGISVVDVDRGGDITYHGPGQLVMYPIVDLAARGRDLHRYLRLLEEAIIRTLAEVGVVADRLPPHTGVWVGERKIAALGIKVSRGVSFHGLALNIAPAMAHFAAIVPCGLHDKGVISLADLLDKPPPLTAVSVRLAEHLGALLGIAWQSLDLADQPLTVAQAALTGH